MSEDQRGFYEKYFVEQDFSPEELLKQIERVKALDKLATEAGISGLGLIVGVGKGADISVAPGDVVALDLPFTYLPKVKERFPEAMVLQGDGTRLPFSDDTFDYLICSEVLEHVPDREGMIAEFHRVLRPGGILLLTTPNWLCSYGAARFIVEKLSRKEFHAGEQPTDNWTTPGRLTEELAPYFQRAILRGWWYFPPIGKGDFQLMPGFFAGLWKVLMPIERISRVILPRFGHSVCIAAMARENPVDTTS